MVERGCGLAGIGLGPAGQEAAIPVAKLRMRVGVVDESVRKAPPGSRRMGPARSMGLVGLVQSASTGVLRIRGHCVSALAMLPATSFWNWPAISRFRFR